jgi:selenide,water dikinase
VKLAENLGDNERTLLTDPQTSGGLLVSCSPETVTEVLSIFLQQGFSHVSVIGEVVAGEPAIEVL